MQSLTFAAVAITAAAALLMILFVLFRARKDAQTGIAEDLRESQKDKKEGVCGICFGPVMRTELIAKCACGQMFHDTCAGPTGACPYCETPYSGFIVGTPECIKCPSCGSDIVGNSCKCGTVISRGGMFMCGCGEVLNVSEPVCKRCGIEYDVCSGRRIEEM
jgi:hypothetical protein